MLIDNVKDLDVVMLMYNLRDYTKNYRKTTGCLSNYYLDKAVNPITHSEHFKYKTSITAETSNNGNIIEIKKN